MGAPDWRVSFGVSNKVGGDWVINEPYKLSDGSVRQTVVWCESFPNLAPGDKHYTITIEAEAEKIIAAYVQNEKLKGSRVDRKGVITAFLKRESSNGVNPSAVNGATLRVNDVHSIFGQTSSE